MARPMLLAMLSWLLSSVSPGMAAAPVYQWKTEKDSFSLMADAKAVYCFHFAADGGYPYIHPVSLPGGPVMSAFAPADHPWHRGLWLSWKFLNGVNYWEFPPGHPNQPDGKTAVVGQPVVETSGQRATIRLKIGYSKGDMVLGERRELVASFPRPDGSYTIDWTSVLAAKEKDVVFERTPPQQFSWGGYAGLGFRAAHSMRDFRAIDSQGRVGRQQAHGKQAQWMDFSGVFDEPNQKPVPAGIAIFDHPSNPRHPTHWYLSDTAGLPYFGPALLFVQPLTLQAGKSLLLKYRVLVHPGLGNTAALEKEFQAFAKQPAQDK